MSDNYEKTEVVLVARVVNTNKWIRISEYTTHTGTHTSISEVDSPTDATRFSGPGEVVRLMRRKESFAEEYGARLVYERYRVRTTFERQLDPDYGG